MSPSNSSKTTKFSDVWSNFRSWLRYNLCFCKGVLFASGLLFSDKLIEYSIMALLITYLLVDKEVKSAAIFAMIQEAVSTLLEIFMTFISDALFGRFIVIAVSSSFYIIGLVLLYHGSDKFNSSRFEIIGILLLALGKAGVKPLIQEFIVDQYKNHKPAGQENPDEDQVIARKNLWCRLVWFFSAIAGTLIYLLVGDWSTIFMISAVATGSSLILYLCGTAGFYHQGGIADTISRFNSVIRDPTGYLVKMKTRIGKDDKDPIPNPEELKKDRKRKRKEKFKYFRRMGRMWTTFLLFGLVLSAGKTYFPYQGEDMEDSGFLSLLVVIQSISRKIISYLFELSLSNWILKTTQKEVPKSKQKKAKLARIWLGMLLSIPCFVLAWHIEKLDHKDTKSVFLLVPQFCFLGFMEGLAQDGLNEFMSDLFPRSRKDYVSAINTFVIGLGNISNMIGFYVYRSWYGKDGLHQYLKTLTIVGSVNLCYYSCISIHLYLKSKATAEAPQKTGVDDNIEETDAKSKNPAPEPSETGDVYTAEEDEREEEDIIGSNKPEDRERPKKDSSDNTGDNPCSCLFDLFS